MKKRAADLADCFERPGLEPWVTNSTVGFGDGVRRCTYLHEVVFFENCAGIETYKIKFLSSVFVCGGHAVDTDGWFTQRDVRSRYNPVAGYV